MFVEDIGRKWFNHPWSTKSKLITSESEINQLLEFGITEVAVDIAKSVTPGDVVEHIESLQPVAPTTLEQVERRQRSRPDTIGDTHAFEAELPRARKMYLQALNTTREFMNDLKTGRKVEVEKVQENVEQLIDSVFRNRDALLAILKLKNYDEYTFTHSLNVAVLAVSVARHLEFSRDSLSSLGLGGIFHDVGKTRVPNDILNKPARLTPEEFMIMKAHPTLGVELFAKDQGVTSDALEVIRHHHERIDGSGYPDGLTEDRISPMVAISGLADVYDALSSDRVYHKGLPPHEALKIIFGLRGKHFSPNLVDRFIHCLGIYPSGTTVELNTGEVGIVLLVNHASLLKPQLRLVLDARKRWISAKRILDLSEPSVIDRSIVRVLDPKIFGIDVAQYFDLESGEHRV